ncbi:MAG: DEAD/DEAH box helicase, partial [Treponema sp.]|nr:DEAD/DEAH box helicase [Treponema sp.]
MTETDDRLNLEASRLFGVPYLFPYQRLVVENILRAAGDAGLAPDFREPDLAGTDRGTLGRQTVILPTGAGKSLCFQLPAALIDGITLVIYPLLSLMADQERRLKERGFAPALLRGGQTRQERAAIWQALESGRSKMVIANPEVLLSPEVSKRFSRAEGGLKVAHVVIDEAHCVSQWGESFRPAYLEIRSIVENVAPPLVTAFTATAGAGILEKIDRYIFGPAGSHLVMGNPDRPNIAYAALGCVAMDLAVRDLLLANALPAIVFCSSRIGTERLSHYLRSNLKAAGVPWHRE